ncbi:MAG: hypothetical protein H8E03_00925 [Pelagibacteraceae bacterium]|nr:hypothetical protein [Pelagibacteraceae bacterium]
MTKEKIFLAYGCSFTWGHGLQYYDWIEKSEMSGDEIKEYLLTELHGSHYQWANLHSKITQRDMESMRKLRYIDLISQKLDMDYITDVTNGGDNYSSITSIETILNQDQWNPESSDYRVWGPPHWMDETTGDGVTGLQFHESGSKARPDFTLQNDKLLNREIDFVILQLTHPDRNLFTGEELRMTPDREIDNIKGHFNCWMDQYMGKNFGLGNRDRDEMYVSIMEDTLDRVRDIHTICNARNIKLFVWSYPGDIAYIFKDEPYFLKIPTGDKEYNSYDELVADNPEFCLGHPHTEYTGELLGDLGHCGVTDEHPSKEFHKLISEIILDSLESEDIV